MINTAKTARTICLQALVRELAMRNKYNESSLQTAQEIVLRVRPVLIAKNKREVDYEICFRGNRRAFLRVIVHKGSLFTFVWSTFGRIDDHYELLLVDPSKPGGINKVLLTMRGVDQLNSKVAVATCDWVEMSDLMVELGLSRIGLLQFVKILGSILFCYPYFQQEKQLILPMPLMFMFEYLTTVASCPFLTHPTILKLISEPLTRPCLRYHYIQRSLQALTSPDGSGRWLEGFHYSLLPSGQQVLLAQSALPSEIVGSRVLRDVRCRVVELLPHPLVRGGVVKSDLGWCDLCDEFIVLLELVHQRLGQGVLRLVSTDLSRVVAAVDKSEVTSRLLELVAFNEKSIDRSVHESAQTLWDDAIPAFDAKAWGELLEKAGLQDDRSVNFLNSFDWGKENQEFRIQERKRTEGERKQFNLDQHRCFYCSDKTDGDHLHSASLSIPAANTTCNELESIPLEDEHTQAAAALASMRELQEQAAVTPPPPPPSSVSVSHLEQENEPPPIKRVMKSRRRRTHLQREFGGSRKINLDLEAEELSTVSDKILEEGCHERMDPTAELKFPIPRKASSSVDISTFESVRDKAWHEGDICYMPITAWLPTQVGIQGFPNSENCYCECLVVRSMGRHVILTTAFGGLVANQQGDDEKRETKRNDVGKNLKSSAQSPDEFMAEMRCSLNFINEVALRRFPLNISGGSGPHLINESEFLLLRPFLSPQ